MKEQWKAIDGYPGYEISNHGRVWSHKTGKLLKLNLRGHGYWGTRLCKNGKVKTFAVARLVAQSFIPNPENLETVNHIDEDPSNNHVSNLEWLSHADNVRYSQSRPVNQIDIETLEIIKKHYSLTDAGKNIGKLSGHSHISHACQGKLRTAYGYKWEYAHEGD